MQQPITPRPEKPKRKRTKNPAGQVAKSAFVEGWEGAKSNMGDALATGILDGITNLAQALMTRGINVVTARVGEAGGVQALMENPEKRQQFPPWMEHVINGNYAVVTCVGPRDSGKCCSEDTLVLDASTGKMYPIKDFPTDGALLATDQDLKLVQTRDYQKIFVGVGECVRIKLWSGREVTVTPEHPLRTVAGWVPAGQLAINDFVAAPRFIPVEGQESIGLAFAGLLGYVLGDGQITKSGVRFVQKDQEVMADFVRRVEDGGMRISWVHNPPGDVPAVDVSKLRRGFGRTRLRDAFGEARTPVKSGEKDIPGCILTATNAEVAEFLACLYAADGCVTKNGISLSTVSENLARGVQHLLLRLGIRANLRRLWVRYRGEKRGYWGIAAYDSQEVRKFVSVISIPGPKGRHLQATAELKADGPLSGRRGDVLPAREAYELVGVGAKEEGLCLSDVRLKRDYRSPTVKRSSFTYATKRLPRLSWLTESDVIWDRIVEIEDVGMRTLYDFEVPGLHNFVAADIVLHNTTATVAIAEERQRKFGGRIFFINYPESLAPEHIVPVHASQMMALMEVAEPGSTIIIDDASILVNSKRGMTDQGIGFENLINTVAHRGILLAINVQDTSDLNKAGLRADMYMLKDPDPEFLHTERPRMRVIMQHAILAFANIPEEDRVRYVFAWVSGTANGMVEIIQPEWLKDKAKVKYHGQAVKDGGFDPNALDSRIVEGEFREVDAPIRRRQADQYDDGVGPLV